MDIKNLRCFIPVGGQAKRLKPLTYDVAKPCIRFLNRPLIEFAMVTLAEQGVRNFIFGEMGHTNYTNLFDQYGEGVGFSAKYRIYPRVHIKHQPNLDDLGSADSYRLNMEYYDVDDPVLVVQGDSLFELNLNDLIKKHEQNRAIMTIALTDVDKVEEFGIAKIDGNQRILGFIEKPSVEKAPSHLANSGIYLLSPEVRDIVENADILKLLKEKKRLDFGYDFIPYLIDKGCPIFGYKIQTWYDIGSPERYLKAMLDVLHGKINMRITEEKIMPERNIWVQGYSEESVKRREEIIKKNKENKLIINDATLIGRHTRMGDYSKISESNIDNFCIIGEHTDIFGSAIMDAVKIGDYSRIIDSIIGRKVIVESNRENPTWIESTSVIGNATRIKEGCRLIKTKVNPNLTIPQNMTYIDKFIQNYEDVIRLASQKV